MLYTEDEMNELILCWKILMLLRIESLLKIKIEILYAEFGDVEFLNKFTNSKKGVRQLRIFSHANLFNRKDKRVVDKGPDAILNGGDPFIEFVKFSDEEVKQFLKIDDLLSRSDSEPN
jgi:hypothetical protein